MFQTCGGTEFTVVLGEQSFRGGHESSDMCTQYLIPIDDSEPSWEAFSHALETDPDGEFTVLHVIDPLRGDYMLGGEQNDVTRRSETLSEEVTEFLGDRAVATEQVHIVVEEGQPEHRIVSAAEEREVDQIVIGSRGRSGLSRVLLGSVAETVVRRAPVPVTVVR